MTATRRKILVTDFDGTMTRRDFYQLIAERHLPPGTPDFWVEYRAGRMTHFEALRNYFLAADANADQLVALTHDMHLEPDLPHALDQLHAAGWEVVVASAGCRWYIDRLFKEAGVSDRLALHANEGHLEGDRLVMELPQDAPFFSPTVGIDKPAIVRDALSRAEVVAFAGDGPPDLESALLVPPNYRFATGFLAEELTRLGEGYRPFARWRDVARALALAA